MQEDYDKTLALCENNQGQKKKAKLKDFSYETFKFYTIILWLVEKLISNYAQELIILSKGKIAIHFPIF